MDQKDPYAPVVAALSRMEKPLADLVATHDQFVLQSVTQTNNTTTIRDVRKGIEQHITN